MPGQTSSDRLTAALLAGAAACLVFAVLLTVISGLTFFADEWNVILRPNWSADSLFRPLNEHIFVGPVIVYKLLLAVFGLDSTAPFRIANIA